MAGTEAKTVDIKKLEAEVFLAELRMRKAEAAVRYHDAMERLKQIRAGKKAK